MIEFDGKKRVKEYTITGVTALELRKYVGRYVEIEYNSGKDDDDSYWINGIINKEDETGDLYIRNTICVGSRCYSDILHRIEKIVIYKEAQALPKKYVHQNGRYAEEVDEDFYEIYTVDGKLLETNTSGLTVSSVVLESMGFEGVEKDVYEECAEYLRDYIDLLWNDENVRDITDILKRYFPNK